jgi:hypothetical protein
VARIAAVSDPWPAGGADARRYWHFLGSLVAGLTACELVLSSFPRVYGVYSTAVGYVGLTVEATLALPQLASNQRAKSCRGFRPSVLANWLLGDALKMVWFFSAADIPWAFKICGIFQACCDVLLGLQFYKYGG